MISEIRNAFLDNLKNLTWMDKETRMAAINKANAITDMIGKTFYIFWRNSIRLFIYLLIIFP